MTDVIGMLGELQHRAGKELTLKEKLLAAEDDFYELFMIGIES